MAALARSLTTGPGTPELRLQVVAAACLSTMTVAVDHWARHPLETDLPDLLRSGFHMLSEELR